MTYQSKPWIKQTLKIRNKKVDILNISLFIYFVFIYSLFVSYAMFLTIQQISERHDSAAENLELLEFLTFGDMWLTTVSLTHLPRLCFFPLFFFFSLRVGEELPNLLMKTRREREREAGMTSEQPNASSPSLTLVLFCQPHQRRSRRWDFARPSPPFLHSCCIWWLICNVHS